MGFPFQTFQQIVNQYAVNCGQNPFPSITTSAGIPGGIQAYDLAQWAQFLTEAVRSAWLPFPDHWEVPWPFTVKTKTVTPSGGIVAYSDLENADWFVFWSISPGPYNPTQTAYKVLVKNDAAGIYPQASLSTYYAFYRPLRPQFTDQVFVAAQTYPAGSLVYDPQVSHTGTTHTTTTMDTMADTSGIQQGMLVFGPGITAGTTVASVVANISVTLSAAATSSVSGGTFLFGSGNVFMALASALGSAIQDPTQWAPQTVPDPLVVIILRWAEALREEVLGNDSKQTMAAAVALRDAEIKRSLPLNGPPSPWAFDSSV